MLGWGCLGDLFESYGGLVELPVMHFGTVVIWWAHEPLRRSGAVSSTWATYIDTWHRAGVACRFSFTMERAQTGFPQTRVSSLKESLSVSLPIKLFRFSLHFLPVKLMAGTRGFRMIPNAVLTRSKATCFLNQIILVSASGLATQ